MNDKLTNSNSDENIARKLNQAAEQISANSQFAAELEERLRDAHQPKSGWFVTSFKQVSPTLRWVALMILLALVLSLSIKTLIPAPQPAVDDTPVVSGTPTAATTVVPDESATPVTQEGGYDFRGAELFLKQPLPESPGTAHVYLLNKEIQPATEEQARALADRFGIQGEMYTSPGYIFGATNYLISDGKQSLEVQADKYFSYASDMAKSRRAYPAPTNPNAESIIRDFLNAHGFDFPFRVYPSLSANGYIVQPLAPDTIPIQYESFSQPMMRVVLDVNGQVLTIDASLMDYDQNPIGEYGIITAEEALQRLLDQTILTGKTEYMHSAGNMPQEWYREYPDNQSLTAYGYVSVDPAVDPGKPALILLGGVPVLGNTTGMESLDDFAFIQATGQFNIENGIRKFTIESWDRKVQEAYLTGTLTRQGDQILFTSDDGSGTQYTLTDPPADVPLDTKVPDSQLAISGVIVDGTISWTYIQFFAENSFGGGGGGGGGLGFYQLNLNGTPIPFPSPTPAADIPNQLGIYTIQEGDTLSALAERFGITVDELMRLNGLTDPTIFVGQNIVVSVPAAEERTVDDLRGYLSITIHNKTDGTSSREYNLEVTQDNGSLLYALEGSILSELDSYHGLPVLITGTINTEGKLVVESYKIPYPDLHFQILKGTQRSEQIDGQTVVIFTTEDGKSYVEFLATNPFPAESFTGYQGDLIQQEVLIIPDETFGGMPVAHIYQSAIVQEGAPEMQVQANQVYVFNDTSDVDPSGSTRPNLIIENVELTYFVSNPYYQMNDPNYNQRSPYIQPVWHFEGRYEDGTMFDVLIQALEQEFLLPELAPGPIPG